MLVCKRLGGGWAAHSRQRHPDCRASELRPASGAAPRWSMRARRAGRDGLAGAQGIQRCGGRRVSARRLQPDAAAAAAHARRRLGRAAARVQAQRGAVLRVPGAPCAGHAGRAARGPTATPQECVRWRRDSCGIDKQRTLMQDQRAIACLFGCTTSATRRHVHQTRQHAHLWFRTIRAKRAALCVCAHVRVCGCQARREQAQEAQRPRQPCTPCSWPDQDARCLCGFERSPLPGAAVHAEQQACTAR